MGWNVELEQMLLLNAAISMKGQPNWEEVSQLMGGLFNASACSQKYGKIRRAAQAKSAEILGTSAATDFSPTGVSADTSATNTPKKGKLASGQASVAAGAGNSSTPRKRKASTTFKDDPDNEDAKPSAKKGSKRSKTKSEPEPESTPEVKADPDATDSDSYHY